MRDRASRWVTVSQFLAMAWASPAAFLPVLAQFSKPNKLGGICGNARE